MNPWDDPPTSKDIKLLYYIFYYISILWDKFIKGIKVEDDDPEKKYSPETIFFRPFAEKINVIRIILLVGIKLC